MASTPESEQKAQKDHIDLSKLPTLDYLQFFIKCLKGTPPEWFCKLIGWTFGSYGLFSLIVSVAHYFDLPLPGDLQSTSDAAVATQPQGRAIVVPLVQSLDADKDGMDVYKTRLNQANKRIAELNEENSSLKRALDKKPGYSTCYGYQKEVDNLTKTKTQIDTYILKLLNPQLTKEQIERGMSYSAQQLDVFTKQAGEYRKSADDLQKQILALDELRKPCG